MFARVLIQECQPGTVEELTRMAEETFVDQLREVPGFVSYEVIKVNEGRLVAIGYFETREGAERMDALGAEWRRTIGKDHIISAVPHVGELIFQAGPTAEEPRAASPEAHAPL